MHVARLCLKGLDRAHQKCQNTTFQNLDSMLENFVSLGLASVQLNPGVRLKETKKEKKNIRK